MAVLKNIPRLFCKKVKFIYVFYLKKIKMREFSKKDLQLLYEIELNARTPRNRIAKKMNMSQQGLSYKIQQ